MGGTEPQNGSARPVTRFCCKTEGTKGTGKWERHREVVAPALVGEGRGGQRKGWMVPGEMSGNEAARTGAN